MNNKENTNKMVKDECINHIHLIDVANVLYGYPLQAKNFCEDSSYLPVVRIRDIKAGFSTTYYRESVPMEYIVHLGDILVGMDGEFNLSKWRSREAILNQRVCKIESKDESIILNQYLFHLLGPIFKKIEKNIQGSTVKHLSAKIINSIKIPLPPLPIQQEIVRILDTFTNLTAELTDKLNAELTARRKQYEYYRDELMTFGEDVPKLCLSEIATEMYRGSGIKRDEVSESGIPCVRYGEIYTTYDVQFNKCVSHVDPKKVSAPKYFEYGDVLFAITGESVSDIAKSVVYLGSDICLAGGDIVVMKHKQNPRYMAYALSTTNAQIQKSKGKVKSKVVHSSMPSLREIRIPIPSLIEQEKIANILDNFRKLCNGFDEGLPAEISARQKQYEYYRNKLLQFSV